MQNIDKKPLLHMLCGDGWHVFIVSEHLRPMHAVDLLHKCLIVSVANCVVSSIPSSTPLAPERNHLWKKGKW